MRMPSSLALLILIAMGSSAFSQENANDCAQAAQGGYPYVVTTYLPVSGHAQCSPCQPANYSPCSPCQTVCYSQYRPVTECSPCNAGPPPSQTYLRPVVALQPMPTSTYVGQGILGQPTAYVEGQPVRNMLRWLTP